jgi:RNA 2',3'-cyclic 3'-phosphodiesterase
MSFAFGEPASASPESKIASRLFFSVFPDPQTAARMAQLARDLRREHRLKGHPLLAARLHCSLCGFDSPDGVPGAVVAKAQEAASIVAALPFRVSFNYATSFSDRAQSHPWVLTGDDGVIGLVRLHSSLCSAMRKVGLRPRKYSDFTPHVTLLYDARRVEELSIEPIGWTVSDFVLVLSVVGQINYVVQGRWQLNRSSR